MSISKRLEEIAHECLFQTDEEAKKYEAQGGAFTVGIGIELSVKYRADKLEAFREEIRQIAGKIVPDAFIGEKGTKASSDWINLRLDRNGDEWGQPIHANILVSMCNAFGFCEFAHPWDPGVPVNKLMVSMGLPLPVIRFFPVIREGSRRVSQLN